MNPLLWAAVLAGVYWLIRTATRPEDSSTAAAIAAEAARLNVDPAELRIGRLTPETWPDSGLGLSSPFEMTLPVLTPGYRLEVEWPRGGTVAEYHCDARGHCLICPPCTARLSALRRGVP